MKFATIFLLILVMTTDLEARGLGNVRGGGGGGNLSWNQGTRCRGGRGRWSSRLYHNRIRCRLNLGSRNRGMGGMAVGDNIPNFIQNNNNNQGSDEDQEAPCVGICYLQKMQREEAQKAEQNKERQEARERRQQERQDSQEDLKRREAQEELEQQLERQKDKEAKQREQERQKSQEELEQENMEQEAMQADQEMKNKQGSNIQKLDLHCGNHGIACCPHFTSGDNVKGTEIFIQENEIGESCQATCQIRHPESTGITQSTIETYGNVPNGKNKCWCEFGEPVLGADKNYQSCLFIKA